MKGIEQYIPVLTFELPLPVEATEQYFPVAPFIMQHKLVPIFESVDETLKCDRSNESY